VSGDSLRVTGDVGKKIVRDGNHQPNVIVEGRTPVRSVG
jgi:hypothetical protein